MLNALYNQRILELSGNIGCIGALDAPHASAQAHSRLCGSHIAVDMSLDNGRVTAYAQRVAACALGQAAAAIMANEIIGAGAAELRHIGGAMRAMLREGAGAPRWPDAPDKWRDLEILAPVRDFKNRHASTLLVFDAVEDCLSQLGR